MKSAKSLYPGLSGVKVINFRERDFICCMWLRELILTHMAHEAGTFSTHFCARRGRKFCRLDNPMLSLLNYSPTPDINFHQPLYLSARVDHHHHGGL